jgi:hypothetical protein
MEEAQIIELIIDEESDIAGIQAISIVDNPAIEEDFIALKSQEIKLAEVDKDKKIIMGPALIPNKKIFRKFGEQEYFIYFSEDTVKKASELFLTKGNQNNSTLEHEIKLNGLSVVESWIIEDEKQDKSNKYGFNLPVGTWMVSMKVNNDDVWNNYVKSGKVKGFSIEGHFIDAIKYEQDQELEALSIIEELTDILEVDMATYGDYGSGVRNNAKRGIELNKKVNNKCATSVGKVRAQQLARGEKLSVSTIKRMYSYLSRAETYYDPSDSKACGTISYLLWGGKAGLNWSRGKLKELGELELKSMIVDEEYAIIGDRLAYSTIESAEIAAEDFGCQGHHEHEFEGRIWYMPCEKHSLKLPCQEGYEQIGMKDKDGRKVPNCVPIK